MYCCKTIVILYFLLLGGEIIGNSRTGCREMINIVLPLYAHGDGDKMTEFLK